ncbi:MAG TPA: bifunctional diguanylate cyclase/phosphodiesterase [Treponemataceae bacterium]|nr:bifunctional diguanylate cyclase/phosphodiesterase [Treponemataceae bacterium]
MIIILLTVIVLSAALCVVLLVLNGICKKQRDSYYRLAYHDPVTGYPNWNWMVNYISTSDSQDGYDFVHFDVKSFKMINELYGHRAANTYLRQICDEMQKIPWKKCAVRCDNDRFAMITEPMKEEELRIRLLAFFAEISRLPADKAYPIYFRCGVVQYSNMGNNKSIIADFAKMAQRLGVKQNVTEIHFYTEQMKRNVLRSETLKRELPNSIKNGELLVYLQPKYCADSDKIYGAEALIRWNYHKENFLSPAEFVPLLEKNGAIEIIDRYVLNTVCKKLVEWKERNLPLYPISINLSRSQFNNVRMIEIIERIVSKYNLNRSLIEFELTESAAYNDQEYLLNTMMRIRDLGFNLSMDDFGTGFSSLSLLKDMPLTTLKIDKSFVDSIHHTNESHRDNLVVQDIITMTQHLNIASLAEGVETEEQRNLLRSWGCNYIQGYYYSKPIPVFDYEALLQNSSVNPQ